MSIRAFDNLGNRKDLWRILLGFDQGVPQAVGARRRAGFVRWVAGKVGLGQNVRTITSLGVLDAYLSLAALAAQFRLDLEKIACAGERAIRGRGTDEGERHGHQQKR